MINELKMTVPAKSLNEGFVRSTICAFCVDSSPSLEDINDIKTAVSEAITNCVVHAYKSQSGDIGIEAKLEPDSVYISIKDQGVGIDDIDQAMQPLYTTLSVEERSGMGFTVMQTFMDSLVVVSEKGKGTEVQMTKRFREVKC